MSNTDIWDKVKKTDLKYTKDAEKGLTSINGMYCIMKATELFGACGIGWGYEILEERIDDGIIQKHGDGDYMTKTHTVKVKLWFKQGEERGEVTHFGHTPYIMRSKYGAYLDDEAPKKSLTDAIKKCLSMLGVGADIHLGQFDDVSYKSELVLEAKQERENKEKEKNDKIRAEIQKIMSESGAVYAAARSAGTLQKIHRDYSVQLRQLFEKAGADCSKSIENLTNMYNQALEIINKKESK